MKNLNYTITTRSLLLMVVVALTFGCDSFVDVGLPNSQLSSGTVFEERATANAAMTNIYAKLRDTGLLSGNASGMSVALGVYADELDYYGVSTGETQFLYTNNVLPTSGVVTEWWSRSYNQIYAANTVYEGVNNSTKLAQADKDQLMGEALFVRALVHFSLTNLFGAVPYITTTNYQQNQTVNKISTQEVYDRCIADLTAAQALLPDYDFSGSRVRPNKWVATALLARVYLYNGNYAEAANEASAVLNESGTYSLVTDFDSAFLKDSPSTLWQLIPQNNGASTGEGANFIFNSGPPPFVALSSALVTAFEPGDLRRVHWVRAITNGSDTWYHAYKYKQQSFAGSSSEYSIVLRLSELYLIRAEARAKQGFLSGAQDDLNVIRNLAGLPDTTASSQEALLSAILQERRVEFFTESGHRFLDLKRAGQVTTVLDVVKPGWDVHEALFPLPQNELLLNPNLEPQNAGY